MARAQEVQSRIYSLGGLLEIVTAIRAIAAVQMQQGMRSLDAIEGYSAVIARALADSARIMAVGGDVPHLAGRSGLGLVVFGSEHGFCGAFNDRIIRDTEAAMRTDIGPVRILMIGGRGAQIASERGISPERTLAMAPHSAGVTAVARRASAELYSMFSMGLPARLEFIFARYTGGKEGAIERRLVLPIDPAVLGQSPPRFRPLANLPAGRLFEDLVGEYFFAMMETAAMESFTSENAARFRTMEAAHQNIENKTGDLTRLARRLRQEAVTTEILDLIGGAEAIRTR